MQKGQVVLDSTLAIPAWFVCFVQLGRVLSLSLFTHG